MGRGGGVWGGGGRSVGGRREEGGVCVGRPGADEGDDLDAPRHRDLDQRLRPRHGGLSTHVHGFATDTEDGSMQAGSEERCRDGFKHGCRSGYEHASQTTRPSLPPPAAAPLGSRGVNGIGAGAKRRTGKCCPVAMGVRAEQWRWVCGRAVAARGTWPTRPLAAVW